VLVERRLWNHMTMRGSRERGIEMVCSQSYGKDLSILYGTAKNRFFSMYVSDLNYIIRLVTLYSPVLKEELETMLKSHTQIFMQHYQSRMNLIKNEKELIALKNLVYSCKRAV